MWMRPLLRLEKWWIGSRRNIGSGYQLPPFTTVGSSERMRLDSNGRLGLGTASPDTLLEVVGADPILTIRDTETGTSATNATLRLAESGGGDALGNYWDINYTTNNALRVSSSFGSEVMRIDSSGNLLVGKTSLGTAAGFEARNAGNIVARRASGEVAIFDRKTNDGDIVRLAKDGTTVGSIGTKDGDLTIGTDDTGIRFYDGGNAIYPVNASTQAGLDATIDLGRSDGGGTFRFKDLYLSGNAGIGTVSPSAKLDISGTNRVQLRTDDSFPEVRSLNTTGSEFKELGLNGLDLRFLISNTEKARIDTSGNLLVGTTDSSPVGNNSDSGIALRSNGSLQLSRHEGTSLLLNRRNNDGEIIRFHKNAGIVGSIGTFGGEVYIANDGTIDAGLRFRGGDNSGRIVPCTATGGLSDDAVDLGYTNARFDDIYATNGTIQTSDRNEKQDIAELSEAEQRVAIAAKGLLRKFRWKSSVADKGDEARIHFGIIAQDLQDAFTAEGLDSGRYAMFINSTWTDEETGEERSRMGVRYSELLAFIIAAI